MFIQDRDRKMGREWVEAFSFRFALQTLAQYLISEREPTKMKDYKERNDFKKKKKFLSSIVW